MNSFAICAPLPWYYCGIYTTGSLLFSLFLSPSVSSFEGKNFLVLSFSWIAQPFGFRPSHSGWKRQRYKMCAQLHSVRWDCSTHGLLRLSSIVRGCQLADSYNLHLYWIQLSNLTDMFLPSESPFSALHCLVQESCFLPPKADDYRLGHGQSTLRLWIKGWIYLPKVQTSHKSMPSKSMPSAWMILSSGQQTAMKSNFKISGRWIFIKGAADWTSSWISPTVLNGYIKTHWFRR